THILSLNAAIEAAAAGDRGRRFSVVAEEVRRLAQQTRESVDSVRGLLDEFAGAIRSAVVATEEGSKEVARVLERARAGAQAIGLRDDPGAEPRREDARRVDVRERAWFRSVLREHRPSVSEPHTSLVGGESCFTVAAPQLGVDGALEGVVAIDVSVSGWTRI